MSVKRWSLLVLLALCTWGGWWFLSRAFELARDTADESHARAYIKRIDEVQRGFLKRNPGQGFACKNSMICGAQVWHHPPKTNTTSNYIAIREGGLLRWNTWLLRTPPISV